MRATKTKENQGNLGETKTLDRILMIENSFRPKNGEYISKLFQLMRGSKIVLRVVDSEQITAEIAHFLPDLIVIDVDSLQHSEALDLAHSVRISQPETVIIFLSERIHPVYLKEGMIAAIWSRAYWLNQPSRRPEMVLPEITRAFNGKRPLNPEVLEEARRESTHIGLLSPQQHRVMQAMSLGASNAKIAQDCRLTLKAVERTIAAASRLLGVPAASLDSNPRVLAANLYRSSMLFREPLESDS